MQIIFLSKLRTDFENIAKINAGFKVTFKSFVVNNEDLIFIGPCIIAIVDERKTNLMSLAILFHFLCAQHVSDINISIFRSLRLC